MKRLTKKELNRLDPRYQYSSGGSTLLGPYLQVFWWWLAKHLPLWVAPNAITFLGLLLNITMTTIVILYDHNLKGEAPEWIYLLCAVNVFMYQTLDALDGKQCIRTDTDDQLPEIFDHGCDAVSNLLLFISAGSCVGINHLPHLAVAMAASQVVIFYFYHWQCYVSGKVVFKSFDVTEAQFSVIMIFIITYLFGTQLWEIKMFEGSELRFPVAMVIFLSTACSMCDTLWTIISHGLSQNYLTVAKTHVLSPAMPCLLVVINWIVYSYWSNISQSYCLLFLMVFSLPLIKLTINLVIACRTRSEITFDVAVVAPMIANLNAALGFVISEVPLLFLLMVLLWIDLCTTSIYYCYDIACQLNRYMFILPPEVVKNIKNKKLTPR